MTDNQIRDRPVVFGEIAKETTELVKIVATAIRDGLHFDDPGGHVSHDDVLGRVTIDGKFNLSVVALRVLDAVTSHLSSKGG